MRGMNPNPKSTGAIVYCIKTSSGWTPSLSLYIRRTARPAFFSSARSLLSSPRVVVLVALLDFELNDLSSHPFDDTVQQIIYFTMRVDTTLSLLLASLVAIPASVLALPIGSQGADLQERGFEYDAEVMARAVVNAFEGREVTRVWHEARAPMPSEPPSYSKHDPINGAKPGYSQKDPAPIPKYRQKDPHKPKQKPKGSKFWQTPPRSLDELEELEAREPSSVRWWEARAPMPSDPPRYSKHDPINGPKPGYSQKDPAPIPKYRQKDPHKPPQPPKGSKFWQTPPRSLNDVEMMEDME